MSRARYAFWAWLLAGLAFACGQRDDVVARGTDTDGPTAPNTANDTTSSASPTSTHEACSPASTTYDAVLYADPTQVRADGSVALTAGQELVVPRAHSSGSAVLTLVLRAEDSRPWPRVTVSADASHSASLSVHSSHAAEYEFELPASESTALRIGTKADKPALGDFGQLFVERLEVRDCDQLDERCKGSGMFMARDEACAPFVCDTADDCAIGFQGSGFGGQCEDGTCRYPDCAVGDAELSGVRCLDARALSNPEANPSSPVALNSDVELQCPAITDLRWYVVGSIGEGSCAERPMCGPNPPEAFGFPEDPSMCCYVIERICGV